MERALIITTLFLAAQLAASASGAAEGGPAPLAATATVRFTGSSTLHDFEGRALPVSFAIEPAGEGRWRAEVELPVASLTTENEGRDTKLRSMFDETNHPVIRARFGAIDAAAIRSSRSLTFEVEIRGTARAVTAAIAQWDEGEDRLTFDATFAVSLKEFGLEPPSALGFISVDDLVPVTVHVEVRRT